MSKSLYRQITPVATSLTGFHACFHAKADPSMNFPVSIDFSRLACKISLQNRLLDRFPSLHTSVDNMDVPIALQEHVLLCKIPSVVTSLTGFPA
jgi:hypothetical protein